jgi:valyl-tRNA synthetase
MQAYEYAAAKNEVEAFFWKDLADNYLEMAKQRLYNPDHPQHPAAGYVLRTVLQDVLKLFAPFIPYLTEAIYRELFAPADGSPSIHRSAWPMADPACEDPAALQFGEVLVQVATVVRRYKSENNLGLGVEFSRLQLTAASPAQGAALHAAEADLLSVTRALEIEIHRAPTGAENGELQIEIVV